MSLGLEGSSGSNEDTVNLGLLGSSPVTKTSSANNHSEEGGSSMGNSGALAVLPLEVVGEHEPVLALVVVQPGAEVADLHISKGFVEVSHLVRVEAHTCQKKSPLSTPTKFEGTFRRLKGPYFLVIFFVFFSFFFFFFFF